MSSTTSIPCSLPAGLRMRTLDGGPVVVVSFSLAPVAALTRSELEVARLANAALSNSAIARARGVSKHTVARQMAQVLKKLGIGSRLGLATIPEVRV